mgnify:CR=1 FL=1
MAEAPTPQGLLNTQSFGTIAPYEPNMVERAQGLLAQGLMKFGYDPRDAYVQANKIINTQGDVGAADFTPLAGDLIGAQDAYDMGVDAKKAFDRDEYLKALGYGAGSAATGLLSGLGVLGTVVPPVDKGIDAVRAGVKKVTRLLDSDNLITGAERDANFKNWFGDSKVVDEDGKPLTVYHGSADDIKAFNLGHPNRKDSGWLGEGVYTTDNAGTASTYSIMKAGDENPNVMPLNLSLKNPYYATIEEKHAISKRGKAGAREFTEQLKEKGHDGVILKYGGDSAEDIGNREFVVFDPAQVKSIHNEGTYDPKDANILKGIAPIAGAGLLGAGMMRQEEQQPQQGILN